MITQQVMQSMFNKYKVQSDATVDAEANFSSNQGLLKLFNFDALFRGECKADLFVNLVRQFWHLKSTFWSYRPHNLTGKKGTKFLRTCMKNDLFQTLKKHSSSLVFKPKIRRPERLPVSLKFKFYVSKF